MTSVHVCVEVCLLMEKMLPHGVHVQLIFNLNFNIPAIFDLLNFPARGHARPLTQPDTN